VQGVTLASLHAAKGLEWDAVFLVGLADGTLPISHALSHGPDSEAVEEERRLLYVGITRARMHLELSWALARAPGGRQSRKPSRFLTGIAPQAQAAAGEPAKQRRQRGATPRCRVCNAVLTSAPAIMLRRCETCSVDIDEDLLAQLKEWRLNTARELNVPAYVVFTDNTLIAIAESLPADDAALADAAADAGARARATAACAATADAAHALLSAPLLAVVAFPSEKSLRFGAQSLRAISGELDALGAAVSAASVAALSAPPVAKPTSSAFALSREARAAADARPPQATF
jgi:hypothetical protein